MVMIIFSYIIFGYDYIWRWCVCEVIRIRGDHDGVIPMKALVGTLPHSLSHYVRYSLLCVMMQQEAPH